MATTVEKTTRGISPILLVLAALCFLLPFVGVSCNSSAVQNIASALPSDASGSRATACISSISNTDLYSYSGLNLVTGSAPSSANVPANCSTVGSTPTSGDTPTVGVQPLLIVVLVLIIVGIAATALRVPLRHLVALGAALLAAILVIVNNSAVHNAVSDRISALIDRSGGGSGGPGLRALGGVGSFFNIHAALGFMLILVALFAAVVVNAVGLAAATGLRIGAASAAPGEPGVQAAEPPTGVDTPPPPPEPPPGAEPPG